MKIGIIGAGLIVPDFITALLEAKSQTPVEIMGILGTEQDREKMEELQKQHGIKELFFDYDSFLAADIAIVYVAVPNHLHYEFAKKALEADKHVIVEKPFTTNATQAEELVALAKARNKIVFEAISNQHLPNYHKIGELLANIGDLKIVELNYSQYSRRYDLFKKGTILPVFDVKKAGGALMDLNVYNIHFILGLFGKPQAIHYIANIEKDIDTSGILTLKYPTFSCVSTAAKDSKGIALINLQGDEGNIYSTSPSNVLQNFTFSLNDGTTQAFELNEGKHRLTFEVEACLKLIAENDLVAAQQLNEHTLLVAQVLDEARTQVGIEI
jgi:Predicted dehydrogenases and related proteins